MSIRANMALGESMRMDYGWGGEGGARSYVQVLDNMMKIDDKSVEKNREK